MLSVIAICGFDQANSLGKRLLGTLLERDQSKLSGSESKPLLELSNRIEDEEGMIICSCVNTVTN